MTKAEADLMKVERAMTSTRFLGLTTVSLDVDVLANALNAMYDKGVSDA